MRHDYSLPYAKLTLDVSNTAVENEEGNVYYPSNESDEVNAYCKFPKLTMKKFKMTFRLFLIFFIVSIVYLLSDVSGPNILSHGVHQVFSSVRSIIYKKDNVPTIITWTSFFSSDLSQILAENSKQCHFTCRYVNPDKYDYFDADAIIFHLRDTHTDHMPRDRRKEQFYTALNMEAPLHVGLKDLFGVNSLPKTYFNATIDYHRLPTTYFYGYGTMQKAITDEDKTQLKQFTAQEIDTVIAKKTKPILAMISNCHTYSKREAYIKKLANYINITFVGSCYKDQPIHINCSRSPGRSTCEEQLLAQHYFLIAFENNICTDYVTEKFFRLKNDIVPIVLRRKIYKGIAPDDSFIAADDFKGPRALVEYLEDLMVNPASYKRYFTWKNSYIFRDPSIGMCDFCRDLYFKNVTSSQNFDILKYYSNEQCENRVGETLSN